MAVRELSLHVTDVCQFECSFCVWGETLVRGHDPVPREDLERFLRENRDGGFERVNLHGGEPTLRKDLFELLDLIRDLGYSTVSLQTNGWALANPRYTERLLEGGVSLFVISVHGATPQTHDRLAVMPGSLDRIREGMRLVRASGRRLRTNSVVVKENFRELPAIADWVIDHGATQVRFSSLMPTGRAWAADDALMPGYLEIRPFVLEAVRVVKARGAEVSLEGFPRCTVDGYSHHCLMRDEAHGGQVKCLVRGEVWDNHDTHLRDHFKSKHAHCGDCVHEARCPGVFTLYAQNRGWSEFQPVMHA